MSLFPNDYPKIGNVLGSETLSNPGLAAPKGSNPAKQSRAGRQEWIAYKSLLSVPLDWDVAFFEDAGYDNQIRRVDLISAAKVALLTALADMDLRRGIPTQVYWVGCAKVMSADCDQQKH